MSDEPPYKVVGTQDMASALFNGFCSLLRVLHRNKAINVGDVATDIGNTLDFRRATKMETADQHQMLEILYKTVLEIEQAETKLEAVRSQNGSAPS